MLEIPSSGLSFFRVRPTGGLLEVIIPPISQENVFAQQYAYSEYIADVLFGLTPEIEESIETLVRNYAIVTKSSTSFAKEKSLLKSIGNKEKKVFAHLSKDSEFYMHVLPDWLVVELFSTTSTTAEYDEINTPIMGLDGAEAFE